MSEIKEIKINSREEVAYKFYTDLLDQMSANDKEKFYALNLTERQTYMRDLLYVAVRTMDTYLENIPTLK